MFKYVLLPYLALYPRFLRASKMQGELSLSDDSNTIDIGASVAQVSRVEPISSIVPLDPDVNASPLFLPSPYKPTKELISFPEMMDIESLSPREQQYAMRRKNRGHSHLITLNKETVKLMEIAKSAENYKRAGDFLKAKPLFEKVLTTKVRLEEEDSIVICWYQLWALDNLCSIISSDYRENNVVPSEVDLGYLQGLVVFLGHNRYLVSNVLGCEVSYGHYRHGNKKTDFERYQIALIAYYEIEIRKQLSPQAISESSYDFMSRLRELYVLIRRLESVYSSEIVDLDSTRVMDTLKMVLDFFSNNILTVSNVRFFYEIINNIDPSDKHWISLIKAKEAGAKEVEGDFKAALELYDESSKITALKSRMEEAGEDHYQAGLYKLAWMDFVGAALSFKEARKEGHSLGNINYEKMRSKAKDELKHDPFCAWLSENFPGKMPWLLSDIIDRFLAQNRPSLSDDLVERSRLLTKKYGLESWKQLVEDGKSRVQDQIRVPRFLSNVVFDLEKNIDFSHFLYGKNSDLVIVHPLSPVHQNSVGIKVVLKRDGIPWWSLNRLIQSLQSIHHNNDAYETRDMSFEELVDEFLSFSEELMDSGKYEDALLLCFKTLLWLERYCNDGPVPGWNVGPVPGYRYRVYEMFKRIIDKKENIEKQVIFKVEPILKKALLDMQEDNFSTVLGDLKEVAVACQRSATYYPLLWDAALELIYDAIHGRYTGSKNELLELYFLLRSIFISRNVAWFNSVFYGPTTYREVTQGTFSRRSLYSAFELSHMRILIVLHNYFQYGYAFESKWSEKSYQTRKDQLKKSLIDAYEKGDTVLIRSLTYFLDRLVTNAVLGFGRHARSKDKSIFERGFTPISDDEVQFKIIPDDVVNGNFRYDDVRFDVCPIISDKSIRISYYSSLENNRLLESHAEDALLHGQIDKAASFFATFFRFESDNSYCVSMSRKLLNDPNFWVSMNSKRVELLLLFLLDFHENLDDLKELNSLGLRMRQDLDDLKELHSLGLRMRREGDFRGALSKFEKIIRDSLYKGITLAGNIDIWESIEDLVKDSVNVGELVWVNEVKHFFSRLENKWKTSEKEAYDYEIEEFKRLINRCGKEVLDPRIFYDFITDSEGNQIPIALDFTPVIGRIVYNRWVKLVIARQQAKQEILDKLDKKSDYLSKLEGLERGESLPEDFDRLLKTGEELVKKRQLEKAQGFFEKAAAVCDQKQYSSLKLWQDMVDLSKNWITLRLNYDRAIDVLSKLSETLESIEQSVPGKTQGWLTGVSHRRIDVLVEQANYFMKGYVPPCYITQSLSEPDRKSCITPGFYLYSKQSNHGRVVNTLLSKVLTGREGSLASKLADNQGNNEHIFVLVMKMDGTTEKVNLSNMVGKRNNEKEQQLLQQVKAKMTGLENAPNQWKKFPLAIELETLIVPHFRSDNESPILIRRGSSKKALTPILNAFELVKKDCLVRPDKMLCFLDFREVWEVMINLSRDMLKNMEENGCEEVLKNLINPLNEFLGGIPAVPSDTDSCEQRRGKVILERILSEVSYTGGSAILYLEESSIASQYLNRGSSALESAQKVVSRIMDDLYLYDEETRNQNIYESVELDVDTSCHEYKGAIEKLFAFELYLPSLWDGVLNLLNFLKARPGVFSHELADLVSTLAVPEFYRMLTSYPDDESLKAVDKLVREFNECQSGAEAEAEADQNNKPSAIYGDEDLDLYWRVRYEKSPCQPKQSNKRSRLLAQDLENKQIKRSISDLLKQGISCLSEDKHDTNKASRYLLEASIICFREKIHFMPLWETMLDLSKNLLAGNTYEYKRKKSGKLERVLDVVLVGRDHKYSKKLVVDKDQRHRQSMSDESGNSIPWDTWAKQKGIRILFNLSRELPILQTMLVKDSYEYHELSDVIARVEKRIKKQPNFAEEQDKFSYDVRKKIERLVSDYLSAGLAVKEMSGKTNKIFSSWSKACDICRQESIDNFRLWDEILSLSQDLVKDGKMLYATLKMLNFLHDVLLVIRDLQIKGSISYRRITDRILKADFLRQEAITSDDKFRKEEELKQKSFKSKTEALLKTIPILYSYGRSSHRASLQAVKASDKKVISLLHEASDLFIYEQTYCIKLWKNIFDIYSKRLTEFEQENPEEQEEIKTGLFNLWYDLDEFSKSKQESVDTEKQRQLSDLILKIEEQLRGLHYKPMLQLFLLRERKEYFKSPFSQDRDKNILRIEKQLKELDYKEPNDNKQEMVERFLKTGREREKNHYLLSAYQYFMKAADICLVSKKNVPVRVV